MKYNNKIITFPIYRSNHDNVIAIFNIDFTSNIYTTTASVINLYNNNYDQCGQCQNDVLSGHLLAFYQTYAHDHLQSLDRITDLDQLVANLDQLIKQYHGLIHDHAWSLHNEVRAWAKTYPLIAKDLYLQINQKLTDISTIEECWLNSYKLNDYELYTDDDIVDIMINELRDNGIDALTSIINVDTSSPIHYYNVNNELDDTQIPAAIDMYSNDLRELYHELLLGDKK